MTVWHASYRDQDNKTIVPFWTTRVLKASTMKSYDGYVAQLRSRKHGTECFKISFTQRLLAISDNYTRLFINLRVAPNTIFLLINDVCNNIKCSLLLRWSIVLLRIGKVLRSSLRINCYFLIALITLCTETTRAYSPLFTWSWPTKSNSFHWLMSALMVHRTILVLTMVFGSINARGTRIKSEKCNTTGWYIPSL